MDVQVFYLIINIMKVPSGLFVPGIIIGASYGRLIGKLA